MASAAANGAGPALQGISGPSGPLLGSDDRVPFGRAGRLLGHPGIPRESRDCAQSALSGPVSDPLARANQKRASVGRGLTGNLDQAMLMISYIIATML